MRGCEEQSFLRSSGSKILPRFCWSRFLAGSSGRVCVVSSSGSKCAAQHRRGTAATSSTPAFRGLSSCSLLPARLLWPGGDPGTESGIKANQYLWDTRESGNVLAGGRVGLTMWCGVPWNQNSKKSQPVLSESSFCT